MRIEGQGARSEERGQSVEGNLSRTCSPISPLLGSVSLIGVPTFGSKLKDFVRCHFDPRLLFPWRQTIRPGQNESSFGHSRRPFVETKLETAATGQLETVQIARCPVFSVVKQRAQRCAGERVSQTAAAISATILGRAGSGEPCIKSPRSSEDV